MAQATDSIRVLPGIGPKKAELFAKLGVASLADLIRFYPRDYEDRTRLLPIASLEADSPACFIASVVTNPQTYRIPKPGGRHLEYTKVAVADHTGRLNLTFFNASYTAGRLQRGETYCFYGALTGDYLGYSMTNPLFEPVDASGTVTRCIMPIYPLTAGLTNKQVFSAVQEAMARCGVTETLPESVRQTYNLCDAACALREVHMPSSAEALEAALKRLTFEEFYVFSAALALLRAKRTVHTAPPMDTGHMDTFYSALPFTLTGAQRRAIEEIVADFAKGTPMNRLVQGDVGSGKTMVAAAAAYLAAKNGRQAALMAPTEILAEQHHASLSRLFEPLGLRTALLTGSATQKEKRIVRERIASGEVDLAVGTHALLSDTTVFHDLGLVIADEQHRFGVAQRSSLSAKGRDPHLLVMSATPIPRTLALLMYGDLDVSIINEMPPGREKVDTFLVGESYRARINAFIRKQVAEGHQCFVVCPAVEESEDLGIKAATVWAETLQKTVFPELRIALLHGQMKGAQKEEAMAAFARGEADVMVATTVIEVGVDVPNATLMIIEDADRFGLSQLHQLRGRVGRGKAKSYCILTSHNKNPETLQRLKALCRNTDGFRIAEEDLALRGPGDFFGSRQSGLPVFRVANLNYDLQTLKDAQTASAGWIDESGTSDTPEAAALRARIGELFARAEGTMN